MEIHLPEGESTLRIEITNTLGNQQHAYEGGYFSGASFAPALGIFGKVTLVG